MASTSHAIRHEARLSTTPLPDSDARCAASRVPPLSITVPPTSDAQASATIAHPIEEATMAENAARRDTTALQALATGGTVIVASTGQGKFEQLLFDGRHTLIADEPASAGGADVGPGPYEFLLMSL